MRQRAAKPPRFYPHIGFRLPQDEFDILEHLANDKGVSVGQLARAMVRDWLTRADVFRTSEADPKGGDRARNA